MENVVGAKTVQFVVRFSCQGPLSMDTNSNLYSVIQIPLLCKDPRDKTSLLQQLQREDNEK